MFLSVHTVHIADVPLIYFLRIHAIALNTNTSDLWKSYRI